MARVAWEFYDGTTTYELPINPEYAELPSYEKKVTSFATAAGRNVVFIAKRRPVQTISFNGTILEEAQLRSFEEWFDKSRQIRITDDTGREMWVYLTEFNPTRVRSVEYPWRHNYSARAVVLDWR